MRIQLFGLTCTLLALTSRADQERPVDVEDYLKKFGYLSVNSNGASDHAAYSAAIRQYQQNMGLTASGYVNSETIEEMAKPRCGVSDHTGPAQYTTFGGKWRKKSLRYYLQNKTPDMSSSAVRRAVYNGFKYWTDVADLQISETSSESNADLELLFAHGNHGDGSQSAFDGQGGVLAHAYAPENGQVHFDEAEQYTENTNSGINLEIVAAHEIGHALGLGHSYDRGALMFPSYQGWKPNYQLGDDDVKGIRSLYGANSAATTARPTARPTTQRPVRTTPRTTARPTTPPAPDYCRQYLSYNAIVLGHDYTYLFSGGYLYWLTDSDVHRRTLIRERFPGVPSNVDAAVYSRVTRQYLIFKGNLMWRYNRFFRLISRTRIPGRPSYISSALYWRDGRIILFKGRSFYMMSRSGSTAVGPYSTTRYFRGLPSTPDSSVVYRDRYIYFFKGSQYWKMNPYTRRTLAGYPKSSRAAWLGCGPRIARLTVEDPNEPFVADDSVVRPLGLRRRVGGGRGRGRGPH